MMKIRVLSFGGLVEIIGKENMIEAIDTDQVVSHLEQTYPALAGRKYVLAINEQMKTENTLLQESDVVALLPPYSGG
ncbi:MoaD/ThiS family protein [Sphingobacterium chungjuense]|uniref:MoaD/ThiS family protein n=1 Tax=Sphingobacterium chungjuense TaxID=2675553 RepID=UPI001408AC60|nr:MoaD/ThiS family protein [Sphingobacterium chungjuense]